MPQIVRKHLFRIDVRIPAQLFHIPPDIGTADRLTVFRDENGTGLYFLLSNILQQFLLQCLDDKHRPPLALAEHHRFTTLDRFDGDEFQLTHTNARAANRLQDKIQPLVAFVFGSTQQAVVFRLGQFFFFRTENLTLFLDVLYPTALTSCKAKKAVIPSLCPG